MNFAVYINTLPASWIVSQTLSATAASSCKVGLAYFVWIPLSAQILCHSLHPYSAAFVCLYDFYAIRNSDIRDVAQGFDPNNVLFELFVNFGTTLEVVDSTIP